MTVNLMPADEAAAGILRGRPRGLLRLILGFPVLLQRLCLGRWEWLNGAKWMLITTTGRKTGKPHQVMVDVMTRDGATDTYYIEAVYGAGQTGTATSRPTRSFTRMWGGASSPGAPQRFRPVKPKR